MSKRFGKFMTVFAFLCVPLSLSAHTFLIDTWETKLPEKMVVTDRIRVVSAETGIMDMLFDNGHIFFNMYSVPDDEGHIPQFSESMTIAGDIGADYLLKLDPETDGVRWRLYETIKGDTLAEGYEEIAVIDPELNDRERWMALGLLIAEKMISHTR